MSYINDVCPLCDNKAEYWEEMLNRHYECKNCGNFEINLHAIDTLKLPGYIEYKSLFSHVARKAHDNHNDIFLDGERLQSVKENETLPTIGEQIDLMVISLAKILEKEDPANYFLINPNEFRARIGAKKYTGVEYILQHLEGYLIEKWSYREGDWPGFKWRLLFAGWERNEELKRKGIETKRVFMAMQYDSIKNVPDEYRLSKVEWDNMFEIFKAAVEKTGFILYLLKDKPEAGLIDDRMRVEIRNSKFTVADLTFDNRGAYWESGFAEGLGKKVIYTCEKKWFDEKKTHFDTNHLQTIVWEKDNLQKAAEDLKATIRNSFHAEAKRTDD